MTQPQIVKPFYNQNGYTEFNNYVLDYIMPKLSPNAWKVLCFIIRKTKGWQKEQDQLSFRQIMNGTGISNRTTVSNAIKELERGNYIIVQHIHDKITSNTYALNTDLEITTASPEIGLPKGQASTEIVPEGSTEIVLPSGGGVVQKSDSQNKDSKPTIKQRGGNAPLAVIAYRTVANRYPDKATWSNIAETVGENKDDLDFWQSVVVAYISCGWNKINISGMLEFFRKRELPTTKPVNGVKHGRHSKPNPKGQGRHKISDAGKLRAEIERAKRAKQPAPT